MYNFGTEAHLGSGIMSTFDYPSATSIASTIGRTHEDCDHAIMITIMH